MHSALTKEKLGCLFFREINLTKIFVKMISRKKTLHTSLMWPKYLSMHKLRFSIIFKAPCPTTYSVWLTTEPIYSLMAVIHGNVLCLYLYLATVSCSCK